MDYHLCFSQQLPAKLADPRRSSGNKFCETKRKTVLTKGVKWPINDKWCFLRCFLPFTYMSGRDGRSALSCKRDNTRDRQARRQTDRQGFFKFLTSISAWTPQGRFHGHGRRVGSSSEGVCCPEAVSHTFLATATLLSTLRSVLLWPLSPHLLRKRR